MGPDAWLYSSSQASVMNHVQRQSVSGFLSNVLNNNHCLLESTVTELPGECRGISPGLRTSTSIVEWWNISWTFKTIRKKTRSVWFLHVMPRRETWTEELWHANRRRSSHVPACRWVQWPVTRDGFVWCVIPRMYRYVGIPVSWSSDSKTTLHKTRAGTTLRPHLKLFFLLSYANIHS